jgi:hypothetical protein
MIERKFRRPDSRAHVIIRRSAANPRKGATNGLGSNRRKSFTDARRWNSRKIGSVRRGRLEPKCKIKSDGPGFRELSYHERRGCRIGQVGSRVVVSPGRRTRSTISSTPATLLLAPADHRVSLGNSDSGTRDWMGANFTPCSSVPQVFGRSTYPPFEALGAALKSRGPHHTCHKIYCSNSRANSYRYC